MANAKPIPSATVLLIRDGACGGIEVFMVVRHHQIDFASGALVFPGGKVDAGDADDRLRPWLDGASPDPGLAAMQAAAIREAFEECGLLLARAAPGGPLIDGDRLAQLASCRQRLHRGEISLAQFVERERLHLACDQLLHHAHWITPAMLPRRFDTHFFLAQAPPDHLAVHDGHESVDSTWIAPAEALASDRYTVIFPTARNLAKLARYQSVQAALAGVRESPVVTVTPWMEKREDGDWLCIPADAGYDISEERMPERPAKAD